VIGSRPNRLDYKMIHNVSYFRQHDSARRLSGRHGCRQRRQHITRFESFPKSVVDKLRVVVKVILTLQQAPLSGKYFFMLHSDTLNINIYNKPWWWWTGLCILLRGFEFDPSWLGFIFEQFYHCTFRKDSKKIAI